MKECTMPQSKSDYCSMCYVFATGNVCMKPDEPCYWHIKEGIKKELELNYEKDDTIGEEGKRLSCKDCGTDKMNIVQVSWTTYAICIRCNRFTCIHDG